MRTRRAFSLLASGALVAVGALAAAAPAMATTSDGGVTPQVVSGNPTCAQLGYAAGVRYDPEETGTVDVGTGTVTWSHDGTYVTWSSTIGLDAVIVKGGPAANVYVYDPESTGDSGLASPDNPSGGPAGLSHIDFCFDYDLVVSKTANTSLTRTWDWDIAKSADESELTLSTGQIFQDVGYDVTLSAVAADSDYAVDGVITIQNPDPMNPAIIEDVSDVVSPDIVADVDCDVVFPYTLASGGTLTCDYSAELPDSGDRTNTATVTVTAASKVDGSSGTADVLFADATVTEIDECVDVADLFDSTDPADAEELGTLCADALTDGSASFEYARDIGPFAECGEYTVTNVASFVTNDTAATGSDTWTIDVTVPCQVGCTLTQGYWKTHSSYGPAPYDETWGGLEDETFYQSDRTYYEVLWTPPAGNAYYNLAHQFIAATLNGMNGADTTEVDAVLAAAENFFTTASPAAKLSKAQRAEVLMWATTLDNYNNGLIGPGHCSE